MTSKGRVGREIGTSVVTGAVAGLAALAVALGTAGTALAQTAAVPGWVQTAEAALAADPGNCRLHTLRGSYIFAASGYNIVGGIAQPKAIVEDIDFHGDGTVSVPAVTVSINGFVNRIRPGTGGEYTLDEGCVGTLAFTGGPSFDIFVHPTGREGWMIQTNPNTVFQGTLTKVSR